METVKTLIISGAGPDDTCFTSDPRITGKEITWNVTRIQKDAAAGKFGKPVKIRMSVLPPTTPEADSNIDWDKVDGILNDTDNNPINQAILAIGSPDGISMFVDGNHRLAARRKANKFYFFAYIVPHEIEKNYRVRFIDTIAPQLFK